MGNNRIWSRDMRVKGKGESRENTGQVYKVGSRSGEVHTGI